MKKIFKSLFLASFASASLFMVASCGVSTETTESEEVVTTTEDIITTTDVTTDERYQIYLLAKESGFSGSYEEWLNTIRGAELELRCFDGYIQMKYSTETVWVNLISLDELKGEAGEAGSDGEDGEDGREVMFQLASDNIQWKYSDSSVWSNLISIKALTGASGEACLLQVTESYIQWKHESDTEWTNLIALSTLAGSNGKEIELQATESYIQWKYEDDTEWTNLVELSTLVGAAGKQVELQTTEDYIQWRYVGEEDWTNLIALSTLKGDKGETGLGIKNTYIDANGDLIIVYTDDSEVNVGHLTDETDSNATYNLGFYPTSATTASVDAGYAKYMSTIVIPECYKGYTINSIEKSGFKSCTNLTSITLNDTITSIGSSAFNGCTSLASITLPTDYRDVSDSTFYGCTSLTELDLSLVESIGRYAFMGCSNLTTITLGGDLASIGDRAFYSCSSLDTVYFDGTIEDWCEISFTNASANPMHEANNFYILDENGTIEHNGKKYSELTSLTLPNTISTLGVCQFYGFNTLTSLTIPNTIQEIGISAFTGCGGLAEVVIPEGVTNLGSQAFMSCTGLIDVTIPASVDEIGGSAFESCSSLKNVYYKGTLEKWCNISFGGSTGNPMGFGKYFYIADNAGSLSYYGDAYSLLKELTIPATVTSIGDYQFYGFKNVVKLTIPATVTEIGTQAFRGCYRLAEVYNLSSVSVTAGDIDGGYAGNYALMVHTSDTDASILVTDSNGYTFAYTGGLGYLVDYSGFDAKLTLPSSFTYDATEVTSYIINDYAFAYREDITKVTVSNATQTIEDGAFREATNLAILVLPDTIIYVGYATFYEINSLRIYYLGTNPYSSTITTIGSLNDPFYDATWYYFTSNGDSETQVGNWWYYDTDGVTIVEKVVE